MLPSSSLKGPGTTRHVVAVALANRGWDLAYGDHVRPDVAPLPGFNTGREPHHLGPRGRQRGIAAVLLLSFRVRLLHHLAIKEKKTN
jgi:hypothetical protein